jgi:hypothetical protein
MSIILFDPEPVWGCSSIVISSGLRRCDGGFTLASDVKVEFERKFLKRETLLKFSWLTGARSLFVNI